MSTTKSLTERIAERVNRQSLPARRQGRNRFLAMKGDIAQAIEAGWSIKDIWRTLTAEGKVVVSYQAFVGYVKRFITDAKTTSAPISPKPAVKSGFSLNPTANKEELL
jgi:hypothetical protein